MKTLDTISFVVLAMIAIKFVDDVIQAKPDQESGWNNGARH